MARDMRNPQSLGERYLAARKLGLPIGDCVHMPAPSSDTNPSCIDKYGRADEVEPRWEEIQIR